ncbi:MAG: phasin family protein [Burkholderiales bacterium]|nr:phasin family protein [Burkholderiales bacterium]
MLTAEQILAAQKAHIETLFGLTQKAFEGVERMVDLNLQATRATVNEAASQTQALLSIKDAQELLELQATLMQPLAEKVSAYSRQLFEIAADTGAEFTKAGEDQSAEAQHKFMALFDNVARNAPAGSEPLVTAMRSAMNAASGAMDQVQKAVKQATEMTQSNIHTLAQNTSAKPASKKR